MLKPEHCRFALVTVSSVKTLFLPLLQALLPVLECPGSGSASQTRTCWRSNSRLTQCGRSRGSAARTESIVYIKRSEPTALSLPTPTGNELTLSLFLRRRSPRHKSAAVSLVAAAACADGEEPITCMWFCPVSVLNLKTCAVAVFVKLCVDS